MIKSLMSTARKLSWAHLAGVGAARASDDDTDPKDDKGAKGSKASDDDDPPKDDKSAKGAKADDEERKKRDDETDDEYSKRMKALDDEDDKKAKGSKADDDSNADDDDDKDEEMRGSSAAAAARRREQARCAAIFASPAAGKNPVLAAKLAFETRQPRSEAIALLEGSPAPAAATPPLDPRARHAGRGAANPRIDPPGGADRNASAEAQSLWANARKANQALRR